ncbi:MAG: pantoate--beta-alanine ligase [bacterium]
MIVINSAAEMQTIAKSLQKQGKTIACVPTMGFLHEGHLSLISYAHEIADVVITTLFVNPTQFGPAEDFSKYPRDFEKDCLLAGESGADYLFAPDEKDMYSEGFATNIHISGVTERFEGAFRPTHFDGVALIVAKLFGCTMPDIAVFGQKDYQQTLLIKRMISDLNLPVEIVVMPTIRREDGLAKSSRNKYLTEAQSSKAKMIHQALLNGRSAIEKGIRERQEIDYIMAKELSMDLDFRIQYLQSAKADDFSLPDNFDPKDDIVLLAAVYLGNTRLIDNELVKA